MDGGPDKGQHSERATYARWGCRKWRGNEGRKEGKKEGVLQLQRVGTGRGNQLNVKSREEAAEDGRWG